uniref:Leukopyrokinin n=1 Tax=Rhyparobia maderae TaxID=36963 RepID=LPK_RHYMA|nr:RecName: Full=Leukopyrokinin; Short=LPK; AltName: Full=Lem-PK [Rhyparobia maderae]
QTSFTPRL